MGDQIKIAPLPSSVHLVLALVHLGRLLVLVGKRRRRGGRQEEPREGGEFEDGCHEARVWVSVSQGVGD